jgi:hypothetical protein
MFEIAALTDIQYYTHFVHSKFIALSVNPGVLHGIYRSTEHGTAFLSLFFKMSRSIFTRASSALNRANSIFSALTDLAPTPVSLHFAANLTQFSSVCLEYPTLFLSLSRLNRPELTAQLQPCTPVCTPLFFLFPEPFSVAMI